MSKRSNRPNCTLFFAVVAFLALPFGWVSAANPIRINETLVPGTDVNQNGLQFSPDSSQVMYIAQQSGVSLDQVYLTPSNGGPSRRISQLSGLVGLSPVISSGLQFNPDGSQVVFLVDFNSENLLYSVPVAGGTPTRLDTGSPNSGLGVNAFPVRISPDGTEVLYFGDQNVNGVDELFNVPITGGTPVRLNSNLPSGGDVQTRFLYSPDGSDVLYVADQNINDTFELFTVPSQGGTPTRLNPALPIGGDVSQFAFLYSPDGNRVIYRADQNLNDVFELFSVPSLGGNSVRLNGNLTGGGDVTTAGLQVSPDSSRVIYLADQNTNAVTELFSVSTTGGNRVRLHSSLSAGGEVSSNGLQFTPDSSRVIYRAREAGGRFELFSALSTGGMRRQLSGNLTPGAGVLQFGISVSPDSNRVVYLSDERIDDVFELFAVDSDGENHVRLNTDLPMGGDVVQSGVQFSPDSSRVIYVADQENDDIFQLYIVPSSGGTPVKLNAPLPVGGDVFGPGMKFSPDGSKVLYVSDQNADGVNEAFVRIVRNRFSATAGSWDSPSHWDQGVRPDEVMQVFIDQPSVVVANGFTTQREVNELTIGGGNGSSVLELLNGAGVSAINGINILPNGVVRGDGVLSTEAGRFDVPDGAELRSGAGEKLQIIGAPAVSRGVISAIGTTAELAEMEFSGLLTNASSASGTGLIVGRNAVFRIGERLTNQGGIAFSQGTIDVFGDLRNAGSGSIVVTGGAHASFYDDVDNLGQITVAANSGVIGSASFFGSFSGNGIVGAGRVFLHGDLRPGFSPGVMSFGGDLTLGSLASLEIELAEDAYDQVQVAGDLFLDGSLQVSLLDGFAPLAGETFHILDWGDLAGEFVDIELPSLAGALDWDISRLYTDGEISVTTALSADFNGNGFVDGSDLAQLQTAYGTGPGADANGDDQSNGPDFLAWQQQFTGDGPVAAQTVPEPSAALLLASGFAVAISTNSRRRG